MTLDQFARARGGELLDRLEAEVANVSRNGDPEAIHRLRVSIRRLTQALRAMHELYPKRQTKPMRRKLRAMMDLAAEIRNRDVTLDLLVAAGIDRTSPICTRLDEERDAARGDLVVLARQWRRRKLPSDWRSLIA
jgi:CHAD domain-containing protein